MPRGIPEAFGPEIADFPEIIKPDRRCKLCGLAQKHPIVVHVVHELWRQDLTFQSLYRKVGPVFAERELEMPTDRAFARHLRGHVNTALIEDGWRGVNDQEESPPADEHESDYREMRSLYADLKPILKQARADVASKKGKKDEKISGYNLVMLLKLFGEARAILKSLSDMRNSERLTQTILTKHTERLVNFITGPLGRRLRTLRNLIIDGADREVLVAEIDELLGQEPGEHGALYPLFADAARQALDQSRQQYKVH